MSKIAKLQKEPLTRRAVRAIRDAIFAGEYVSGERLVEESLAEKLGVSRNVVREALWLMESQGLVQTDDYKGKSVTTLTFADLAELLPLRLSLESLAATWAARRITPDSADRLRRRAAKFRPHKLSFAAYAAADFELHEAIWELAGNRQMALLLDRIAGPMVALQARLYLPRMEQLVRKEVEGREGSHARIIEAICGGSPASARLAVQKHILAFWQMWLQKASAAAAEDAPESRDAIDDAINVVTTWSSALEGGRRRTSGPI